VDALEDITQKFPNDSLVTPLAYENMAFIAENPNMFINRVNALQDVDRGRVTFVDEPDMTPWPALRIYGDYRSGTALAVAEPERPTEPEKVDVIEKVDLAATEEKTKIEETEEVSTEEIITVEEVAVVETKEAEKVEVVEKEEEVALKTHSLGQTEGTANVEAQKDLSVDAVLE